MDRQSKCPSCKKFFNIPMENTEEHKYFPFCSKRCKLVDFQGWVSGRYRVSRPLRENDILKEKETSENGSKDEDESNPDIL